MKPGKKPKPSPRIKPQVEDRHRSAYERVKERATEASRERSKSGREIGPLPSIADPKRKARCKSSFVGFRDSYFAARFPIPDSQDHKDAIALIETCVTRGGQFALAMPRGSGKTTLAIVAVIWAICYGHRRFLALLAATGALSKALLAEIKAEFETNDLLAADFPEICHPIRMLEGINNRAGGQTLDGKRTRIVWTNDRIILPTVEGSPASGAVLHAAGLTSAVRGLRHRLADGSTIRPDLVFVDDPQTRKSANSPAQVATRVKLIAGDVLGLAGPGERIAAIMPCTVIAPHDAADQLLDRKLHPEWNGKRTKLCYALPTNEALWEQYARLRAESLEAGNDGREATEFYKSNRKAMDAGAVVAWAERFNADEISAVQNVMNLRLADHAVFMAEYQNEPIDVSVARASDALTVEFVMSTDRLTRLPRITVPRECSRVTAFIDVQQQILFAAVCAWDSRFGGSVIDYLAYPEQVLDHFTAADPRPSLAQAHPGLGEMAAIYAGLTALTEKILGREYTREDTNDVLKVEKCPIDANWGRSTETVYRFCRRSPFAGVLIPSHGRGIGASSKPIDEWPKAPGDLAGPGWRIQSGAGVNRGRHVVYCANTFKSFVAERFRTAPGSPGVLQLFGTKGSVHRLLAEHLAAEYPVRTSGRGRELDEWKLRPNRPENHWWDCVVGCAVAASILGIRYDPGPMKSAEPEARPRKKLTLRERQDAARKRNPHFQGW